MCCGDLLESPHLTLPQHMILSFVAIYLTCLMENRWLLREKKTFIVWSTVKVLRERRCSRNVSQNQS